MENGSSPATPRRPKRRPADLRALRAAAAGPLADRHGGVAHRQDLRAAGISRFDVRTEVAAGRWHTTGLQTVVVRGSAPTGEGRWWWAVWESGYGAVLHGVTALLAIGLTGFTERSLHVAMPRASSRHPLQGVLVHRQRVLDPVMGAGVPRARPEWATIRAAQWASSDRQAALLLCLAVQQRLVDPTRLLQAWSTLARSPRRRLIGQVVADVADGAHSLGELDFGGLGRRRGLPPPLRQVVRQTRDGRVYLDAEFADGVVVEIDGSQHWRGLSQVDDALRANELTISSDRVLRIPLIGLRLQPDRFMEQVAQLVLGRGPVRCAS